MKLFTVDTNFFIIGFQSQPHTFKRFASITKKLGIKLSITSYIKGEMRHFLLREVSPFIKVENVDNEEFNNFLSQLYSVTRNVPQKPDLSVIFIAHKTKATIVSSDLKLLETAELLKIPTFTDSAFIRFLLENTENDRDKTFLNDLYSKLFGEEIRYSVNSTNRYDPVKRISKIVESAISVIRSEYEEKLSEVKVGDLKGGEEFSIQSLQLQELLAEIKNDLKILEKDVAEEKYEELENELLERVREITDAIVDWKLVVSDIEDHPTYNDALLMLARLQYLSCICLIENKELDLARVYMDKLLMILFQNSKAVDVLEMDIHFLRIILLLLSGQIQRLTSYLNPHFEDLCIKHNRLDIANLINPTLILLTVVLGTKKIESTAKAQSYEDIEFINQLGFKFMQLGKKNKARLMFEQSFFLALNMSNYGLCILSLEFLSWLHLAGIEELKSKIKELYTMLVEKDPDVETSYHLPLEFKTGKVNYKSYTSLEFKEVTDYPPELIAPYYILSVEQIKLKGKGLVNVIKAINWEMKARVGIVHSNPYFVKRATLGSIIYIVKGRYQVIESSSYMKKRFKIDLLVHTEPNSTLIIKSPGGRWILPSQEEIFEED